MFKTWFKYDSNVNIRDSKAIQKVSNVIQKDSKVIQIIQTWFKNDSNTIQTQLTFSYLILIIDKLVQFSYRFFNQGQYYLPYCARWGISVGPQLMQFLDPF